MPKNRERKIPFQFYVNSDEEFIIREKAASCHKNISAYLRTIAIKGAIYEVNFQELDVFSKQLSQLRFEFNRIGNNINQIARSVNAGIAKAEDAKRGLFLLDQVYELMYQIAKK